MISWWGWSDANRARASPALMVAIARLLITCVDVPLLGRLEEDERGARERKPTLAVEAARVVACCWVLLEEAWRASLRRTLADAMVEVFDNREFEEMRAGFPGRRAFSISHAFCLRRARRRRENENQRSANSKKQQQHNSSNSLFTVPLFLLPSSKWGSLLVPNLTLLELPRCVIKRHESLVHRHLSLCLTMQTFIFTLRWRNEKGNFDLQRHRCEDTTFLAR